MTARALVVIDVQNEYETGKLPITHPPVAESLPAICRAMDAAVGAGVPVIVVQHDSTPDDDIFAVDSPGWQLHPLIASRPRDHHVHKTFPGAFTGTDLEDWLRAHEVDTVTLVGYMTHMCIDSTARQAMHREFAVEVLADATGTLASSNTLGVVTARDMHLAQLSALHDGIGAVATTDEWIAALASGAPLPPGDLLGSAAAGAGQPL